MGVNYQIQRISYQTFLNTDFSTKFYYNIQYNFLYYCMKEERLNIQLFSHQIRSHKNQEKITLTDIPVEILKIFTYINML